MDDSHASVRDVYRTPSGDIYRSLAGDDALNRAYRKASDEYEVWFTLYDRDLNVLACTIDSVRLAEAEGAIDTIETSARMLRLSYLEWFKLKTQWEEAFGDDPKKGHFDEDPEVLNHNAKAASRTLSKVWEIMAALSSDDLYPEKELDQLCELSDKLYHELKDLGVPHG